MADEEKTVKVQIQVTFSGMVDARMLKSDAKRLYEAIDGNCGPVSLMSDDYGLDLEEVINGLEGEIEDIHFTDLVAKELGIE